MRKFAMVGLVGVALATGFVGVSSAAEEVVVANLMIESVSESDVGYATNSARSIAIEAFANEAISIPTVSAVPPEATVVAVKPEMPPVKPVAPAVQQSVAAAAMIVPTPRPDFESSKSVTSSVSPDKPAAQRKVVKVNERPERKRITSLPTPVFIGAFR